MKDSGCVACLMEGRSARYLLVGGVMGGPDDCSMLIRTIRALLILRGITGRPCIAKAKWLVLRSVRVASRLTE